MQSTTYQYGVRQCAYCRGEYPITSIHEVLPAPHASFLLCGRCYALYHQGKLRYYPNTGTLRLSIRPKEG